MQFVPGISSAQTMQAAELVDSRQLAGFGSLSLHTVVAVPMFIAARSVWAAEGIYLFVAAFGAMRHHLPGMIRAYGDGALFQPSRWRFICAPIFLAVVFAAFPVWDLKGIVVVTFILEKF